MGNGGERVEGYLSPMFVHQIAKYISKDDCGLHAPLAGGQAKSNNRDGAGRKRSRRTSPAALGGPDSGVIYVGRATEMFLKGTGLQLRLGCDRRRSEAPCTFSYLWRALRSASAAC